MGTTIHKTDYFDNPTGNEKDAVVLVKRDSYRDNRGMFVEFFKNGALNGFLSDLTWCKQINMSSSVPWTIRGMHAQTGKFCQAKLVTCTLGVIHDFIIDARPDSSTFGKFMTVKLTAESKDSIYIPRGFFHGFFSDEAPMFSVGRTATGHEVMETGMNCFMYMCDNVYNKESEVSINPISFLTNVNPKGQDDGFHKAVMAIRTTKAIISKKDSDGMIFSNAMATIAKDYEETGKLWYRDAETTEK